MTVRVLEVTGALDPNGITTWIKTLLENSKKENISFDLCCNFRKPRERLSLNSKGSDAPYTMCRLISILSGTRRG